MRIVSVEMVGTTGGGGGVVFVSTELEHVSMAKFTLAALVALVVMQSSLPAMAVDRSRAVSCHEQCSRQRSTCQASSALCEQWRKACLASCK
jgi:hypothetical protein